MHNNYIFPLNLDFVKSYVEKQTPGNANKELKVLADQIPSVLDKCREPTTLKKYTCYFNLWKDWAERYSLKCFPVDEFQVALFLLSLIQGDASISIIESCFYAIKFHHNIISCHDPCKAPIVKNMLEAAKRIKKQQVKKKDPITVDHLNSIFNYLGGENADLKNLRTLVICLIGFSGFLRFNEIVNLSRSDIIFFDTYMTLFISKSKTDVYRKGSTVFIAENNSDLCPVKNLKQYLVKAEIAENSEKFIFRAITAGNKQSLRKTNKPISYTRAREMFLDVIKDIGLDPRNFGLHSLRSGGASAAANSGVNDRLFKRHGRWKSDQAKDGYVEDNISALLSVSQTLGL